MKFQIQTNPFKMQNEKIKVQNDRAKVKKFCVLSCHFDS
jgi:hypothetical protein